MGQERLGSLCRISIHKDILKELEDKKKLHDLITEKFIEKPEDSISCTNKSIQLTKKPLKMLLIKEF